MNSRALRRCRSVAALGLLGCCVAAPALAADLLITNARLIDGSGTPPRRGVSIEIRDGRIAAVGRDLRAPGARELDVAGMTVVPGFIDAHVHLTSVPGSAHRSETRAETEALHREHLRGYLACGVTSVLDTGGEVADLREIQRLLDEGEPGPRVYNLAPAFAAPGGYINAPGAGIVIPAVSNAREVEQRYSESAGLPAVGVKVLIEYGFGPVKIWPVHSPEVREAIARSAAERELEVYVHGISEEEQSIGLEMGAHALVHSGFETETPSEEFVERMVASGAYLVTTLAIYDSMLIAHQRERLDAELITAVVPAVEIETAASPRAWRKLASTMVGMSTPGWVPSVLHGLLSRLLLREATLRSWLDSSSNAVARLHEAGVPVVVGSDSGNWPLIPYEFHGPTTLREMELVGAAGLEPMEVIEAATRVAAEMIGVDDEVGTIEPGKRADLVVLREDPLEDLRGLRSIAYTVADGVARTPEQWMNR